VKRYVVSALVESSSEVVSVLTAASMAVHNGHPGGPIETTVKVDPTSPDEAVSSVSAALTLPPDAQPLTVTVNAPPREEAAAKVCEALSPWGQVPVEVVGEEKL
jgi:hypothetical protein